MATLATQPLCMQKGDPMAARLVRYPTAASSSSRLSPAVVALSGFGGILYSRQAPAVIASDSLRPMASWGLQIGDVVGDRAIVWSRSDKPARMFVEWSRDESFANAMTLRGPIRTRCHRHDRTP
jgi:phosphodiesterase/alkaline phosphatase D-like protein